MDRGTPARHRLRWLLTVVLAAALSQWVLPTAANAAFGGGGAPGGTQVALTDAGPDVVTASRVAARLLIHAQAPGPQDHGPEPGLSPDAAVAASLVLLDALHAADTPAVWDPHPPIARDRAPPR